MISILLRWLALTLILRTQFRARLSLLPML